MTLAFYNLTTLTKSGGIETCNIELARAFKQLGHAPIIISGRGKFKAEGLQVVEFAYIDREKFRSFGSRYKKFMERFSFFTHAKEYLRQNRFDAFIISKPYDFWAARFVKKMHPTTVILYHSGGEEFYPFDRWVSKSIDIFSAVSSVHASKIASHYKRDVSVIPNGVDARLFRPDKSLGLEIRKKYGLEDKKVVCGVGRLIGLKGYQNVILSMKKLEGFCFLLCGEGEHRAKLEETAKKYGIFDRVIFAGNIAHDELAKYLNAADVFVQPTVSYESFSITVLEALTCGLAVVASRCGGPEELIEHDKNGLLYDKNDIESLQSAIVKAYEKKEMLGDEAAKSANAYSWEESAKKMIDLTKKWRKNG